LIALAALLVALISSKKSDAQVYAVGPPRESGTPLNELVTGVKYDRINQALAFHRLERLQAKIRVDAERGDPAAVNRDARRITSTRYRISIDEWLIQKNSLQEPCFYPAPIPTDQLTCEAIAAASRPAPSYYIIQR
jgi:hypothetical protein